MSTTRQMIQEALDEAVQYIQKDRDALYECHTVEGRFDSDEDRETVSEADRLINKLAAAREAVKTLEID